MKQLSGYDKLLLGINSFPAILLLFSSVLFLYPLTGFPFLHILNLTVPILVILNLVFLVYWMLKKKTAFLLPALILLFTYFVFGPFYKFNFSSPPALADDLKIMSFNARVFNKFDWIDKPKIGDKIVEFVTQQDPDILCFQEFQQQRNEEFLQYPFRYVNYHSYENTTHAVQAIFSKYPIVDQGSLKFPETGNNAIYADLVYQGDTIRIYNLHLESLGLDVNKVELTNEYSGKFLERVSKSFDKQRQQAKLVREHMNKINHRTLIMGDFNNTQFSNVYRTIKGDLKDTFKARGSGYGSTYNFKFFPVRIDFILVDPRYDIITHTNFYQELSDHMPITASIRRHHQETVD